MAVTTIESTLMATTTPGGGHTHVISDITDLTDSLYAKQDTLVAGTNLKTINGNSLLGPGDITITGGGSTPSGNIYVVNSVADLVNTAGAAGQIAMVISKASLSDHGTGQFIWNDTSTATHDGVLVVQKTGVATGRWIRVVPNNVYQAAWWGIIGDGTNQATKINNAISAIPSGSTLLFEANQTYYLSAQVVLSKSMTLDGNGSLFAFNGGTATQVFLIQADNTTVQNANMIGDSMTYSSLGRVFIAVDTTNLSNTVFRNNIIVRNCELSNYGGSGIYLKWVNGFRVERCKLHNFSFAGVLAISSTRGWITDCEIYDISITSPGINAYAVEIYHDNPGDYQSNDITVSRNRVSNINWEGIDTHGGRNINVIDNRVYQCRTGIAIVSGEGKAPENINVTGNLVHYVSPPASAGSGIRFDGLSSTVFATGIICSNVVFGVAIKVEFTKGLVINGNRVEQSCNAGGIILNGDCDSAQITNNIIIDPWDVSSPNTQAIQGVAGSNVNCYIAGNRLINTDWVPPSGTKGRYGFRCSTEDASDSYVVGYNDFRQAAVLEYDRSAYVRFVDDAGERVARYTAAFTVQPRDINIIYAGAAATATLPPLNVLNHKRIIYITNVGSGALTLSLTVTKADGSTTTTLAAGSYAKLVYDNGSSPKIWMFTYQ